MHIFKSGAITIRTRKEEADSPAVGEITLADRGRDSVTLLVKNPAQEAVDRVYLKSDDAHAFLAHLRGIIGDSRTNLGDRLVEIDFEDDSSYMWVRLSEETIRIGFYLAMMTQTWGFPDKEFRRWEVEVVN